VNNLARTQDTQCCSVKAATHTSELVGNSQLVRNPGFQLVSN